MPYTIDDIKRILGASENGEDLTKALEEEFGKLRSEAEKHRKSKGELLRTLGAENKDDALDKISQILMEKESARSSKSALEELMNTLQAKDKDDALGKVKSIEQQLAEAMDKIATISNEREAEKQERLKTEKEKKEALQISKFTKLISDNKLEDKHGILLDAMRLKAKENEDGQWLIEEKSPEEYIQMYIDSKETDFKTNPKTEIPPHDNTAQEMAKIMEVMGIKPDAE